MQIKVTSTVRSAVHLNELPPKYRQLPVVGRGATSVVLQDPHDPSYVLLLTKDSVKSDWLTCPFGLAIGEHVEEYTASSHRKLHLRNLTINVIRLPKLQPLSRGERMRLAKWLRKISRYLRHRVAVLRGADAPQRAAHELVELLLNDPSYAAFEHRHKFAHMLEFVTNYDDWLIDLHGANVMKNEQGELVLTDPVLTASLYSDIFERVAW